MTVRPEGPDPQHRMYEISDQDDDKKPRSEEKPLYLTMWNTFRHILMSFIGQNERSTWGLRMGCQVALLGAMLGLGSALQFPYQAYMYGRGTFILIYFIMNVCVGIPLVFLEVSWGQFCSRGPVGCFSISPFFKGVGVMMVIRTFVKGVASSVTIVYCAHYMFSAFSTGSKALISCHNSWNTNACYSLAPDRCQGDNYTRYPNGTCYTNEDLYYGVWDVMAYSQAHNVSTRRTSGFEFLRYKVQGSYMLTHDTKNEVQTSLLADLLIVWGICFVSLCVSLRILVKLIVLPVIFPLILLLFLFIRSLSQGSLQEMVGLYMAPRLAVLGDPEVYFQALLTMMRSLEISSGVLPVVASYTGFHVHTLRPVLIAVLLDFVVCLVSGTIVFSFIGQHYDDTIIGLASDQMLIFDAFTTSMVNFKAKSLILAAAFFAFILQGLTSEIARVNTVLTSVLDCWPRSRRYKMPVVLLICLVHFLFSIPFITKGGHYFQLYVMDYTSPYSQFFLTCCNLFVIVFIYGMDQYLKDIQCMLKRPPPKFFRRSWYLVLPVYFVIMAWRFLKHVTKVDNSPLSEDDLVKERLYGSIGLRLLGWLLYLLPFLPIPLLMLRHRIRFHTPYVVPVAQRVKVMMAPDGNWGPDLPGNRRRWLLWLNWISRIPDKSPADYSPCSSECYLEPTRNLSMSEETRKMSLIPGQNETSSPPSRSKFPQKSIIKKSFKNGEALMGKRKVLLTIKNAVVTPGVAVPDDSTMTSSSMFTVLSNSVEFKGFDSFDDSNEYSSQQEYSIEKFLPQESGAEDSRQQESSGLDSGLQEYSADDCGYPEYSAEQSSHEDLSAEEDCTLQKCNTHNTPNLNQSAQHTLLEERSVEDILPQAHRHQNTPYRKRNVQDIPPQDHGVEDTFRHEHRDENNPPPKDSAQNTPPAVR